MTGVIELSPEALKLLGLRHWRWRDPAAVDMPAPSQTVTGNPTEKASSPQAATIAKKLKPASDSGQPSMQEAIQEAKPPPAAHSGLPAEELALLNKVLQAIGESPAQCQIAPVSPRCVMVTLPDGWQLAFDSLEAQRNNRCVCLASLADMLEDPSLKKPVWQKLKTWLVQRQT